MLEIVTIILTLGALLYHSFALSLFSVLMASIVLAFFVFAVVRTWKAVIFALLCGSALILGAVLVWERDTPIPAALFGARAFDARIVSVDRRLDKILLTVQDMTTDITKTEIYHKKIQITLHDRTNLLPGDMITVRGTVVPTKDFVTPTGRIFAYEKYLESKGVSGTMNTATLVLIEHGRISPARTATVLRHSIADIFSKFVTFPMDGVLAGMLVGYQGGIPQSVQDLFRNTGILHVLVLSGYNITILAGFIALILRKVSLRVRTLLTIVLIVLLVMISGSGVASVRAGIMGGIALIGTLAAREYNAFRALAIAYLVFFCIAPSTIFYDPGFHLSFLATLFMITVLPKVEKVFSFLPATRHINIRELLTLAIGVPIFMLPYTMYFSGVMPLATIPANILLAILTPLIMVLGIMLLAVSWVAPLATVIGLIISLIGTLTISLLRFFSHLPIWNTPPLAWWSMTLFYTAVLGILFRGEIRQYVLHLQKMLLRQTSSSDS